MQQINLLDASLLPPRRDTRVLAMLAAAALGALLVLGHHAIERGRLDDALRAPPPPPAAAPEAAAGDALAAERADVARLDALHRALGLDQHLPADAARLLAQIAAELPEDAWLTAVEVGRAERTRIEGGILDPRGLPAFAARLGAIERLRGVPVRIARIEPLALQAEAAAGGQAAALSVHRFVVVSGSDAGDDAP